jgi:CubicO group peptidase (beta-lactamase class C family)
MRVRNSWSWALLALLAPLPSTALSPAPADLPDTPAGRRLAAYLQAFNSDDPAKLEDYLGSAFSPASLADRPLAPRLAFHRQVRSEQGKLEVLGILESSPEELLLRVRGGASRQVLQLGVAVEAAAPHHVLGFRVELGEPESSAPAEPAPATPLTLEEARAAIDAAVTAAATEDRFSGVVAIRRGETPWFERAVGLANREAGIPNRLDTRFNLGSIQKFFTKTVIARLCQEGKLRLDERLIDVLPNYPNAEVARQVTIGQLVDHKAGFGDFFGSTFRAKLRSIRTQQDYLALFVDRPLLFPPGERFEYSNAGYIVLGLVIEARTGLTYEEAVRRNVFEPAGMKSTSLDAVENEAADRAIGYWKAESLKGPWSPNRDVLPGRGSSAGGSYSTAADLIRFVDAMRSDRLLSFGWTEWLLGGAIPAGDATSAAAGRHSKGMGIAGGAEGINAVLFFNAGDGSVTVVLSNLDEPSAEHLAKAIRGTQARIRPEAGARQ